MINHGKFIFQDFLHLVISKYSGLLFYSTNLICYIFLFNFFLPISALPHKKPSVCVQSFYLKSDRENIDGVVKTTEKVPAAEPLSTLGIEEGHIIAPQ